MPMTQHFVDLSRLLGGSQGQGGARLTCLNVVGALSTLRPVTVVVRPGWGVSFAEDLPSLTVIENVDVVEAESGEAARRYLPDGAIWWDLLNEVPTVRPLVTTVSMVHDLLFLDHPEYFAEDELAFRTKIYGQAINDANVLLTTSDFQSQRIMHWFGRGDAHVLRQPPGLVGDFLANTSLAAGTSGVGDYWFFPAVGWPHKNHYRLLQAFLSGIASGRLPTELRLVMGELKSKEWSSSGWRQLAETSPNVELIPFLDDAQFAQFMAEGRGVIYPSLYEGYGLPPLEAAALGVPVLTSEIPSIAEACRSWPGEVRLMSDPTSPSSLLCDLEQFATASCDRVPFAELVDLNNDLLSRFVDSLDGAVRRAEAQSRRPGRIGSLHSEKSREAVALYAVADMSQDVNQASPGLNVVEYSPWLPGDRQRALLELLTFAPSRYLAVAIDPHEDVLAVDSQSALRRAARSLSTGHGAAWVTMGKHGRWLVVDRQSLLLPSDASAMDAWLASLEEHERTGTGRLIYVDPALMDGHGHNFELAQRVAVGAKTRNLAFSLVCGSRFTDFPASLGSTYNVLSPFATEWSAAAGDPGLFEYEFRTAVASLQSDHRDIIFMPSMTPTVLLGMLAWLLRQCPQTRPTLIARADRAGSAHPPSGYDYVDCANALIRFGLQRNVVIVAESEQLRDYLVTCGFAVERILLNPAFGDDMKRPSEHEESMKYVSFLGDARLEKGFARIPEIASQLLEQARDTSLMVNVQTSFSSSNASRELISAVSALSSIAQRDPRLRLLGRLESGEYAEVLRQSSVLALPYDSSRYVARGTGLGTEALAVGARLVTFPDSDVADTYGPLGAVVAASHSAEDFVSGILTALSEPRVPTTETLEEHGVDVPSTGPDFVSALTRMAETQAAKCIPPGHHLAMLTNDTLGQGNSAVFDAQESAFKSLGHSPIRCVVPYPSEQSIKVDDSFDLGLFMVAGRVVGWYPDLPGARADMAALQSEGNSLERLENLTATLEWPAWVTSLFARCECAHAVINYVFNAPALKALKIHDSAPVVLEMHDLLEKQFALQQNRVPSELAVRKELTHIGQRADLVVAISQREASVVADLLGPDHVRHVMPSLTTSEPSPLTRFPVISLRRSQAGTDTGPTGTAQLTPSDLLFVGSDHHANQVSLDWFLSEVYYPILEPVGVTLIVAGLVGPSMGLKSSGSMSVTGPVRNLSSVFAAARISALVVKTGAGVPIKILDSWRRRHPFVMTSFPLDAMAIAASEACAVDSPRGFAADVQSLLADPALLDARASLGEALYVRACGTDVYNSRWAEALRQAQQLSGNRPPNLFVPAGAGRTLER